MIIPGKNGRRARFQFIFGEPTRGAHQHKSSLLKSWREIQLQKPWWRTSKGLFFFSHGKCKIGTEKCQISVELNLDWEPLHTSLAIESKMIEDCWAISFADNLLAWLVKKGSLKSQSSEKYFDWLPWNLKWRTHNYSEMAACTFSSEKYYQRIFTVDPQQFHG